MRTLVLSALFAGALGVVGCGATADDDGSFSESALRGKLADGGTCRCEKAPKGKKDAGAKPEKGQSDAGRGNSDGEHGNGGEEHGKSDAGRGNSGEEHGKSDQEHGKPAGAGDEDEATDEDAVEDEEFEALKVTPDGGVKSKKPKQDKPSDCSC